MMCTQRRLCSVVDAARLALLGDACADVRAGTSTQLFWVVHPVPPGASTAGCSPVIQGLLGRLAARVPWLSSARLWGKMLRLAHSVLRNEEPRRPAA